MLKSRLEMQQENSISKSSDIRQSVEYGKYMASLGWSVKNGVFLKRIFPLPFYFAKYQRPSWPINFKKLIELLKKNRVIMAVVEPNFSFKARGEQEFKKYGFKKSIPMLPSKTIWINLNTSEEKLLANMHSKTRYNIKKHQEEIKVVCGDQVSDRQLMKFYSIYKKNSKRQKFWGVKEKELENLVRSFSKKAYLLLAEEGGLLILIHDKVAYYSHNASSIEGKKKFVPTGLTWEAIRLAKKLRCVRFDFEGISDERYPVTKRWGGFTRFKKGFGGEMIEYVGLFKKWRFL